MEHGNGNEIEDTLERNDSVDHGLFGKTLVLASSCLPGRRHHAACGSSDFRHDVDGHFCLLSPLRIETSSSRRYMLVRRALASAVRSATTAAPTSTRLLHQAVRPSPPRAVAAIISHRRTFGSRTTSIPSEFLDTGSNNTMGGKGVLIAVKPDGTPHSSSSNSEALTSLGIEASSLTALWKTSNAKPRPAEVRLFYGQGTNKDTTVVLVGVGKVDGLDKDALLERTRVVAATGVKALREVGCTEVGFYTLIQDIRRALIHDADLVTLALFRFGQLREQWVVVVPYIHIIA